MNMFGDMPDPEDIEKPKTDLASEVWSADNVLLGKYWVEENRVQASYDEISSYMINSILAAEDIRFHSHSGIDFSSILAIPYYLAIGKKRGGSSITQQLAKNLFKTRRDYNQNISKYVQNNYWARILVTKIKESILAIKLETHFTKEEILTIYLNSIFFGSNSFGLKTACKTFFNKSPKDITIEEASLLAGLIQSPSRYNPHRNYDKAIRRRNIVLNQLEKYNYITETFRDSLKEIPLNIENKEHITNQHSKGLAPYLRAELQKFLSKWSKANNVNIYKDGLKIYTTINSKMQRYAEESVTKQIKQKQALFFKHWKNRLPWEDEKFRK